jgi:hypothetical protein
MDYSTNGFPLRQNADGSYDCICPRCFLTIAKRVTRPEVDLQAKKHICSAAEVNAGLQRYRPS